MKLTRIRIQNLRCIEDAEIHIRDFTSLIGPNNCGKSSFIRGIDLLLSQQAPDVEEWRNGFTDQEIIIEGDFDDVQDWERAMPGVAGIVHGNRIQLKMRASIEAESGKVVTTYEAKTPQVTIDGWADAWGELDPAIKEVAGALEITGAKWKGAASKELVKARVREVMPERVTEGEAIWSAENISIKQALQQAIPQSQVVPAVRDASTDGKPGAKTSFGLLLSRIILPAVQESPAYQELIDVIDRVRTQLGAEGDEQLEAIREVADAITDRLSTMISARVRLTMDPPDAGKFVGANTNLRLDDGTDTSIALQGHGLQRSLIFALIEVLAKQEARRQNEGENQHMRSTVLLFEEPELYFHPHIMRRLKQALHSISKNVDWQVVVTTHSPFLIDVGDDPQSLVIFKRANSTTPPTIKQLTEPPFGVDASSARDREALRAVLNFHPSVCEAFFASRTVLVEGPSEIAVLVHLANLHTLAGITDEKRAGCTVVSCVGKWTIPAIARLLRAFEIRFRVIHDLDAKGRPAEVLNALSGIDPYCANIRICDEAGEANLLVVEDTLEDILWEGAQRPISSGDKPFRAWKRVSELCDGRENLDHAPRLRDLVRFAFDW